MDVLLVTLKILGIVILCIIAILLVVILLVLFVPFRYKYRLKYNDDDANENCHYVDLTWILRIIKLRIFITLSGVDYEVKIFGIRSKFIEEIIKKKNKLEEDTNYNKELDNENSYKEDNSYEKSILSNVDDYKDVDVYKNINENSVDDRTILEKIIDGDLDEVLEGENNEDSNLLDNNSEYQNLENESIKKTNLNNKILNDKILNNQHDNYDYNSDNISINSKKNKIKQVCCFIHSKLCERIKAFFDKINYLKKTIVGYLGRIKHVLNPFNWLKILSSKFLSFTSYIINTINLLLESIKSLIYRISLIIEFLDRPSNIKGIEKVKEYIVVTCKHVLPSKKKIVLCVGFDDPSQTGQLLAVAGIVYPLFGKSIEIYPNFSDKEFKADCMLKGRIRGVNVVFIVIKIMKDKIIKRLIYNINKLKEELDNVR